MRCPVLAFRTGHRIQSEESTEEILDGLTETIDRSEKRRFPKKVEKAAISAKTKL